VLLLFATIAAAGITLAAVSAWRRDTHWEEIERMANIREQQLHCEVYAGELSVGDTVTWGDHEMRIASVTTEIGPPGVLNVNVTFDREIPEHLVPDTRHMIVMQGYAEIVGGGTLRAVEPMQESDAFLRQRMALEMEMSAERLRRAQTERREARLEAHRRSIVLLKEWLTPKQLDQYERTGCFEVIGDYTGNRYWINKPGAYNIDVVGTGKRICVVPIDPNLAEGDVMLAQKIALETNETETLRIANTADGRHSGGYSMLWIADDII